MRVVAGRLKADYNYSSGIVYNNFVWPQVSPTQEAHIAELAQAVLDARDLYPTATIAQLYKLGHEWLYPELYKAHQALDEAVERAYGLPVGAEEKDIVATLFELYAQLTR